MRPEPPAAVGPDRVPRPATPCDGPPHRGRVLVVAPHPDDETIGPGATLAAHVDLGDRVEALFVTTGVHGDPDGAEDPGAYVERRRAEANAAAERLGIADLEFWEYPDSCEVTDADLDAVVARLADALGRRRPDVIYAPHVGEVHADHHYVARAVARARAAVAPHAVLLGYEVWSPLQAEFVVDVGATYERKLEAVRCYASQLEHTDIERAVDGLNRFRAILLPGKARWAEVFTRMGPEFGEAA